MVALKLLYMIKRTQTMAQDKSVLISKLEMAFPNNPSKFHMIISMQLISMKTLTLSLLNSRVRSLKSSKAMNC